MEINKEKKTSLKEQELFYDNYWANLNSFSSYKVIRVTKIMKLLNEIRKSISYPTIIDLGCGDGRSVPIWNLFGKTTGFELSTSAVETARQNFPFVKFLSGDATDTRLPDGSFDVVISHEVIEHIENQEAYLSECARIINQNGFLIITTPNKYYFERTKGGNYSNQPIEKILLPSELKGLVENKFKILKSETVVVAKGDSGIYKFLNNRFFVGTLNTLGLYFILNEIIQKQMLGVHICFLAQKQ